MLAGLFAISDSGQAVSALGFGAALVFIGVALLSPRLVGPIASLVGRPIERFGGMPGRLARENVVRQPGRTAVDIGGADDRRRAGHVRVGVRGQREQDGGAGDRHAADRPDRHPERQRLLVVLARGGRSGGARARRGDGRAAAHERGEARSRRRRGPRARDRPGDAAGALQAADHVGPGRRRVADGRRRDDPQQGLRQGPPSEGRLDAARAHADRPRRDAAGRRPDRRHDRGRRPGDDPQLADRQRVRRRPRRRRVRGLRARGQRRSGDQTPEGDAQAPVPRGRRR